MSHDTSDPFEQSIANLMHGRESSVRLWNCVASNPSISGLTLRDFLSDRVATRNLLLRVPNVGRKTADELLAVADAVALELRVGHATQMREAPRARLAFMALVNLLKPIGFPIDLLAIEMTTRLRSFLKATVEAQGKGAGAEGAAVHRDLGAVLADWPGYRSLLRRQANVGRTTITELENIIERVISRKVALVLGHGAEITIPMEALSEERLDESFHQPLIDAAECSAGAAVPDLAMLLHGSDQDLHIPPREHIQKTIARLPEKECETVTRRYGLDGEEPQTLELIASRVHVTRERVRQVEAKALGRLRIGINRLAFERLLEVEGEAVWNFLADDSDLVTPADLQARRHGISPHFLLAVEVCHGQLTEWMNTRAQVALGGWLRAGADPQAVQATVVRVAAWARTTLHPVPLATACKDIGIAQSDFVTAARFRPEVRLFEGYVCLGQLGSQARRTCRLHRLFVENGSARPFDISALRNAYAAEYPDDAVSPRMLLLQLLRAPHLFFRLFDSIWICLRSGLDIAVGTIDEMPFSRRPMLTGGDFEAGSIGDWLHEVLKENGPSRTADLRKLAATVFGDAISQSSVSAVLQSNPDFVRVAPGVYGLQSAAAIWSEGGPTHPTLLSDTQCRYYSLARRSGDPITIYPGWSRAFEMSLCHWASSSASDDNYRSVLAVAEPSLWPVHPDEAAEWQARKRSYGSYRLPILDTPKDMRLPSAGSFLSSATYLAITGSIAWTTVNRASQRRIDSVKAASTLALLVRFGLAPPASHWQERHSALTEAAITVAAILADLSKTGVLSWDEGHLRSLRTEKPKRKSSTYPSDFVEAMLHGGEASADSGAMMGSGVSAPDVESLFGSDDWAALFNTA